MQYVYIKFPKTGLGNMLLPWARGIVFAKSNHLPCINAAWWSFKWGTLLRRESRNRLYWGYFKETPLWKRLWILLRIQTSKVIYEPNVQSICSEGSCVYVFNKIMVETDLFAQLEDQQTYLYEQLLQTLQPTLRHKLNLLKPPVIGMHIRRGDFKRGSTITPNAYFINGINLCRQIAGKQLPVTVFSDAAASEIQDILDLPFVTLSPPKEDVLDILLLSKSDILFLSATSTFSYWAGFFSNSIVIRPNSDWLPNIKKKAPLPYQEIIWDGSSQFSFELNFQNTVNEG